MEERLILDWAGDWTRARRYLAEAKFTLDCEKRGGMLLRDAFRVVLHGTYFALDKALRSYLTVKNRKMFDEILTFEPSQGLEGLIERSIEKAELPSEITDCCNEICAYTRSFEKARLFLDPSVLLDRANKISRWINEEPEKIRAPEFKSEVEWLIKLCDDLLKYEEIPEISKERMVKLISNCQKILEWLRKDFDRLVNKKAWTTLKEVGRIPPQLAEYLPASLR